MGCHNIHRFACFQSLSVAVDYFGKHTRPAFSQLLSFKIRRTTFVDPQILGSNIVEGLVG